MRPPLQLFQRAHLKVRDTGSPRGQFLRPAIGDVREADRQSFAGTEKPRRSACPPERASAFAALRHGFGCKTSL